MKDEIEEKVDLSKLNLFFPLGSFGELTLNELALKFKDLHWDFIYEKLKVSVNIVPVAASALIYSLILKSYMKHVHNRPFRAGISDYDLIKARALRSREMQKFLLIGAPLTMFIIGSASNTLKERYFYFRKNK